MKKVISVLLTVALLLGSVICVNASSVTSLIGKYVTRENAEKVVTYVARKMINAGEHAVVHLHNDVMYIFDRNGDDCISLEELLAFYEDYVMIDISALNGSAEEIAKNARYKMTVMDNGETTTYVFVDLDEYPELFVPGIFAQTVLLIDEEQERLGLNTNGDYHALRYSHIAGELVLHEIIYVITNLLGGQYEWNPLNSYYNSAIEACVNVDEARVPSWIIDIVGIFSTLTSLAGQMFVKQ